MFMLSATFKDAALHCHKRTPSYVHQRLVRIGISDEVFHRYLLGWNGRCLTIPIVDGNREIASFKFASRFGERAEPAEILPSYREWLYGWDVVRSRPDRIIICQSMFDRLVLLSHGIPAVSSTGNLKSFQPAWLDSLRGSTTFVICIRDDITLVHDAIELAGALPARVVFLPRGVVDIAEFFRKRRRTVADFETLLEFAFPEDDKGSQKPA